MRMKETFMRAPWPIKALFFIVIAILYILVFSTIVMWLWNAILPKISNLQPISYIQAAGLLILSKILFGSMNFGKNKEDFKNRSQHWRNKWRSMSSEEKHEMKERWKRHCDKRRGDD